jgi:hypothetical protein
MHWMRSTKRASTSAATGLPSVWMSTEARRYRT